MKKNAMRKNLRQSIVKSFGRYIAIVMIIALGSALFVGLLMTKADMVATGQHFMDEQNMFDIRILNSYGWKQEHFDAMKELEGIEEIEAVRYIDMISSLNGGEDAVYRLIAIPEKMNRIALRGGRMPEAPNECLADGFAFDDAILGKKLTVLETNGEDSLESVTQREFIIVGYVATPLYMDMNRGTTSVGNGSLSSYFYVQDEVLQLDYIPEVNVTIPGDYAIYTDRYNDALEAAADRWEPELQKLADHRLEQVLQEAKESYQEGLIEYRDGLVEYAEGKAEADKELADAYQELLDGEQEIKDNEQKLIDGEQQIEEGKQSLLEGKLALLQGRQELAAAKTTAIQQMSATKMEMLSQVEILSGEIAELEEILTEIEEDTEDIDARIEPLESSLSVINSRIETLESLVFAIDSALEFLQGGYGEDPEFDFLPSISGSDIQGLVGVRNQYEAELAELYAQREELNAQLNTLYAEKEDAYRENQELQENLTTLEDELAVLTEGLLMVMAAETAMEEQFASAEAQIAAGEAQLEAGQVQLEIQEQKIADGWVQLEEGKQELKDGWKEYEEGKLEAEQELADALLELQDGAKELADGWETIQKMTENDVIILDRNSNVGYNNLDSSSDIVQGVSRVFPVFFLLVASLVCITTMTRMIDEERTQIGTLKALGYSNGAIIGKYLFYSGSGAVIGCGLGVAVGSSIFPTILWQAYMIMLYIQPNLVLTVNWWLCFAVIGTYTAVLMLVTWYCCRKALQEEPAELIRPKSPDAGKKILMEYLPFWNRISFLNKVTIRNIFRYRQRLAMMLVGIGGCTALLVTGYGLRDSIVNVVDYQFEDVTLYDMEVYFKNPVNEETHQEFLETIGSEIPYMYYHQSSMDLEFDDRVKEIYMISGGEELSQFLNLHRGENAIPLPGLNEVVLSVGVSEMLGLNVGDSVKMRNSDLQTLELTVSGIYDNHVYNYSIVSPETIESQWGLPPDMQMAFLMIPEDVDIHILGTELTDMIEVMNVNISADMADMVRNMMEALDLVVVVIVFCAGLLAVIVLYNLTNININERIREIATIKVLGFRAGETGAYVFKENMTLTVVGALFGLLLGNLLLAFVMSQIKIDMVWFKSMVMPMSYVWSVLLTLLAAIAVDFIFYFKLQSINMAEALKSVE